MAVRLTCVDNASGHDGLRWRMGLDAQSVTTVVGETPPGAGELVINNPLEPEACFSVVAYAGGDESDAASVCATTLQNPFDGVEPGTYLQDEGGYFTAIMFDEFDQMYGLITSPINGGLYDGTLAWQGAVDWCAALSLNGLEDWRLPTIDERILEYRTYKPFDSANSTGSGATDRVDPPLGNYTSNDPGQTPLTDWQDGGAEAFNSLRFWSSTETSSQDAIHVRFFNGFEEAVAKTDTQRVRAVRRVYF